MAAELLGAGHWTRKQQEHRLGLGLRSSHSTADPEGAAAPALRCVLTGGRQRGDPAAGSAEEQQLPDRPAWGHHLNQAWSSCSALLQPLQSLELGGRADATQQLLVFTMSLPWLITDQFQPLQGQSEFD